MSKTSSKDLYRKARDAEKAGLVTRAARLYSRLAGHYLRHRQFRDAGLLLRRAVKISDEKLQYLVLQAVAESELKDERAAKLAMRKASRKILILKRRSYYERWLSKVLESKPGLLEFFYEGLLEVERTSASSFLILASLRGRIGDEQGAIRYLLDALNTRSNDPEALLALRKFFQTSGKTPNAGPLPVPEQALLHLERFETGALSRADLILLLKNGPPRGPLEAERALSGEKSLGSLIAELEQELGGKFDDGLEMVAPLVEEFRKRADVILGEDGKARYDMALAFFEMGLFKEAKSEIDRIGLQDPLFVSGQLLLGEIFLREESQLAALDVYQRCLRNEAVSSQERDEAEYRLIEIYYVLGDLGQALLHLRRLERESPSYRDVKSLRLKLETGMLPGREHSQKTSKAPGRHREARAAKK